VDEPVRVDAVAAAISADLGSAPLDVVAVVAERLAGWLEPRIADLVEVRSLVDGELVVETADASTAADLGYRREELAQLIGSALGPGVVRKVRVVVKRGR
jgi:hypothetical protein